MKKGAKKTIQINISNRLLYTLIAVGIVLIVAGIVYAATYTASGGGHPYTEISTCPTAGQILKISGGAWTCASDAGLTSESDPQVGTITTSGRWCTTDGSAVQCTTTAPVTAESDPNAKSWAKSSSNTFINFGTASTTTDKIVLFEVDYHSTTTVNCNTVCQTAPAATYGVRVNKATSGGGGCISAWGTSDVSTCAFDPAGCRYDPVACGTSYGHLRCLCGGIAV
jgi:hypothetical protein